MKRHLIASALIASTVAAAAVIFARASSANPAQEAGPVACYDAASSGSDSDGAGYRAAAQKTINARCNPDLPFTLAYAGQTGWAAVVCCTPK